MSADLILTLAADFSERMAVQPVGKSGEIRLSTRAGRKRPVKVERLSDGWAAWNAGSRINGLVYADRDELALELAECIVEGR